MTIEAIEAFRSEAISARDYSAAAIASVALGDNGDDIAAAYPDCETWKRYTLERAQREVERMIAAAAVQCQCAAPSIAQCDRHVPTE